MPAEAARESARVIRDNFGTIDADGSGALSRGEILQFSQDPQRSDRERAAAADFHNHFDLVAEMAPTALPESLDTEPLRSEMDKIFKSGDFNDFVLMTSSHAKM